MNGHTGISAEMALRLAERLDTTAESWLRMPVNFDLWQARQKPQPHVEKLAA